MSRWPPPRGPHSVAVVIPSSNIALYKDLRLKTRMVGDYVRALAVFRVSTLAIFKDPDSTIEDYNLFIKISRYMLVPPYLRIKTEALSEDLRFAGILPPLTIYPHNPEGRQIVAGDVRFGLVLSEHGLVDIGWEKPCRLLDVYYARPGDIKLVKLESTEPLLCREVIDPPIYAGYRVVNLADSDSLTDFLKHYDLVINTSKTGVNVLNILEDREILNRIGSARSICLLFGNPKKDFDELAGKNVKTDLILNFIPNQGTLTVRTYEALVASLAILNLLLEIYHAKH
ncbi:MAG: putative RNA uridine N3 methyltransferase [Sulfolobales archaeon]